MPNDDDTNVAQGRVVRLNFECKAELPMGSMLRVTGSSLWAPTSLTNSTDPTNAHHIAQEETKESFPAAEEQLDAVDGSSDGDITNANTLYTSSVEMVTSPETYPIWRTKSPVIVTLYKSKHSHIQHHYYRYMVVTPGATVEDRLAQLEEEDEGSNNFNFTDQELAQAASTTNEFGVSTPVMQWEHPFEAADGSNNNAGTDRAGSASKSSMSIASNWTEAAAKPVQQLANLPYRTLDISIMEELSSTREEGGAGISPTYHTQSDIWNNGEDDSYKPYVIRQSMSKEKSLGRTISDVSDDSLSNSNSTSGINTPTHNRSSGTLNKAPQNIYFICFHLPVVVVKQNNVWKATWSESLLASKEGSKIVATYRAHWIGTVTANIESDQDKEQIIAALKELNCTPIFLDPTVQADHYYGFCKQVLWPAFHNIDLLDLSSSGLVQNTINTASDWDQSRLDHWWQAYQSVNQTFCKVVNELIQPDSYLWIHDYHLSMLPQYLSATPIGSTCRKVFFLHIPFPTSQIFRELECGEDILQGILHADVVGFHAFDHARHFLNAAKRIFGCNYESLVGGLIGIQFQNRTVLVSMSNVSIEPNMAQAALALPSVEVARKALKDKHGKRKIISTVDHGQRLSGTSLKLLAFERLLKDYPSWQSKVVMVLRILVPNSRKADETLTTNELRNLVKRIQQAYGEEVIDYQEFQGASNYPLDQRMALWKATDVLMSTPIREGLNHWPMEYIFARSKEDPGVVIASEFSAVCSILNGALRVNPFDIQMAVTIIDKALSMDLNERQGRRYRDIDFVSNSQSDKWVRNVLRDLKDVTSKQRKKPASSSSDTPSTPASSRNHADGSLTSTAAFLIKESTAAFTHLNLSVLQQAYNKTSKRVIILDFNGTIVMKEPPGKYLKREILGTSGNKPPPEVLESLSLLCEDPRNLVYVISGDSSENVLNALGHLPKLGLAVSNGATFSPPMQEGETERNWKTFDLGVDWDAVKRVAWPVLSKYTARSNGSFVKLTTFSIGWSYYSCDPEWGSLQASHLVLELENELKAFDVRFVTLKGIVEIVPRMLNKGLLVKKVLKDTAESSGGGLDFLLCMGDDISDEKMFTSCFSFIAEMDDPSRALPGPSVINEDGTLDTTNDASSTKEANAGGVKDAMYCYTVAVGKKPSHANMYVTDSQEVASALVLLAKGSLPETKSWAPPSATHLFT